MSNIEHWMAFSTFAEQRYFAYPDRDTYNGVLISGNMACHASSALATFLLEKATELPYIIDPVTHAFQHNPDAIISTSTKEVKSSIKKLADSLGTNISELVGKQSITPEDLKGQEEELVENCLKFQETKLYDAMQQKEVLKYFDKKPKNLTPYALVSPYFYMTETTIDKWLGLNLECAKLSTNLKKDKKIFVPAVVSRGIISDPDLIKKVVERYRDLSVDGFLIWVDNLNESAATGTELKGLVKLAKGLRGNNEKEVINLHGGYFSILSASELGGQAMTGVAHGPEFGEYRSVVPVGGGIPKPKYYMRRLHIRMRYKDAAQLIKKMEWFRDSETYYQNVCGCPACDEVIGKDIGNFTLFDVDAQKERTKERCLEHYLNCKKWEYEFASGKNKDEITRDINKAIETFKVLGLDTIFHLEKWLKTLNNRD